MLSRRLLGHLASALWRLFEALGSLLSLLLELAFISGILKQK